MTKTLWCVFRFAVLTAVHLQNANTKFHKVWYRHYSGEAKNVYISIRQIYSGQYYRILSQSVWFCRLYIKKHLGVFYFGSPCRCVCVKINPHLENQ